MMTTSASASSPRAIGYGPLRSVRHAEALDGLPPHERCAVLLHELGHLYHRHPGKRVLRLFNPKNWRRLAELCRQDEFEADEFAASFGFGLALRLFLERLPGHDAGPFHPSVAERIARLNKLIRLAGGTSPTVSPPNRAKEKHCV